MMLCKNPQTMSDFAQTLQEAKVSYHFKWTHLYDIQLVERLQAYLTPILKG
jgi:hypothetical protein